MSDTHTHTDSQRERERERERERFVFIGYVLVEFVWSDETIALALGIVC